MRILIVANHNKGVFVPFITEQVDALKRLGIEADYFGVHGKGIRGYLSNCSSLKAKIRDFRPDLIHAHYGLSGLLSNLQRKVPVVTTYHGSDIHAEGRNLMFSRVSIWLSAYNIFVTEQLQKQAGYRGSNQCTLPCGIDTFTFFSLDRLDARKELGWDADGKYVLFSGAFDNPIKNSPLAKKAVEVLNRSHRITPDAQLVELRGFTRQEVNLAMNAANSFLMTSHREGSPQVVKEAMVCGTPVVSVNVGDVKDLTSGIAGCYIASHDANDIAQKLESAFSFQGKTNGYQRIIDRNLSNEKIAQRILDIYNLVLNKK